MTEPAVLTVAFPRKTEKILDRLEPMAAQHARRRLARILRPGRRPGTWDLLTGIGDQELDVALKWAAIVTLIIPYSPTPDDAERLLPIT